MINSRPFCTYEEFGGVVGVCYGEGRWKAPDAPESGGGGVVVQSPGAKER